MIQVVPDTIHFRQTIRELSEPKIIETERTKVVIQYDTVLQEVIVEAISKPQEIPVQMEREITTIERSKSKERRPRRANLFNFIFAAILGFCAGVWITTRK